MSDDYAIPPDAMSDTLIVEPNTHTTILQSARTSCIETATNTLTSSSQ